MYTRGWRWADVAVGWRRATSRRRLFRKFGRTSASSSSVDGRDCIRVPGTERPSPYTRSAGEAPISGFSVVRIARRLHGRRQNQSFGSSEPRAIIDSFRRR